MFQRSRQLLVAAAAVLCLHAFPSSPASAIDLSTIAIGKYAGPDAKPWSPATAPILAMARQQVMDEWRRTAPSHLVDDKDLLAVMESVAALHSECAAPAMPSPQALAVLKRAFPRNNQAPIVVAVARLLLSESRNEQMDAANRLMQFQDWAKDDYKGSRALIARGWRFGISTWGGDDPRSREARRQMNMMLGVCLGMALHTGEFDASPRFLLRFIDNAPFYAYEEALSFRGGAGAPGFELFLGPRSATNPWLAHMARGIIAENAAWGARGGGFANTVTDEGWQRFREELQIARQEFSAAAALTPQDPWPAMGMLAIALNTDEDVAPWIDKVLTAAFDYPQFYDIMLNFGRPRWGGTHESMVTFARACVDTGRFDTDVPFVITRVICGITTDKHPNGRNSPALKDPRLLAAIDRCIDGYLSRKEGGPARAVWYQHHRALMRFCCGDKTGAQAILHAIPKDQLDPTVVDYYGLKWKDVLPEMAEAGKPGATTAAKAKHDAKPATPKAATTAPTPKKNPEKPSDPGF
jgi:hypothetical protein